MKSCKTCKWWKDEDARTATGRLSPGAVAPCLYPTEKIQVPESHPHFNRKLQLRYMAHSYGTNCPCYEKKAAKK